MLKILSYFLMHYGTLRPGSCTSELQLKVNYRIKFGLARPTLADQPNFPPYNSHSVYKSLSAAIHLYMIRPLPNPKWFSYGFFSPQNLQCCEFCDQILHVNILEIIHTYFMCSFAYIFLQSCLFFIISQGLATKLTN